MSSDVWESSARRVELAGVGYVADGLFRSGQAFVDTVVEGRSTGGDLQADAMGDVSRRHRVGGAASRGVEEKQGRAQADRRAGAVSDAGAAVAVQSVR